MAEASAAGADAGSAVAAHRFFCHFCKGEVSPKLPVRAPCVPTGRQGWERGRQLPAQPPIPLTPVSSLPAARCPLALAADARRQGPGRSPLPSPHFRGASDLPLISLPLLNTTPIFFCVCVFLGEFSAESPLSLLAGLFLVSFPR